MRGDVVYRVYGVHEGRAEDVYFTACRTRADAQAVVAELRDPELRGRSWAQDRHNRGFVIREHVVDTDFEVPPRPAPREKYAVRTSSKPNPRGWDSTVVDVALRGSDGIVCSFERDHAMWQTFEPFRRKGRELALISRHYTQTAVLDLASGEVIAEESESSPGAGFCPVGFYVPDWWDVHDGSIIPGSAHWTADDEGPVGDFGFVWGCHWGDDSSWKVQYLDLSRVADGVITRDARFGYVKLATGDYVSPCFERSDGRTGDSRPPFITVELDVGPRVTFEVEVEYRLASGAVVPEELDYDRATGELIPGPD